MCLQDGPTAAVEAQQLGHGRRWGYFTMVLSQRPRRVAGGRRRSRRLGAPTIRPPLHSAAHDGHTGGWATCGNESRPAPYADRCRTVYGWPPGVTLPVWA